MEYFAYSKNLDISNDKPEEINLLDALDFLINFPEESEEEPDSGSFFGFINKEQETIQFTIKEQKTNSILIDIPYVVDNKLLFMIQETIKLYDALKVIKYFFCGYSNLEAFIKIDRVYPTITIRAAQIRKLKHKPSSIFMESYYWLLKEKDKVVCDLFFVECDSFEKFLNCIPEHKDFSLILVNNLMQRLKDLTIEEYEFNEKRHYKVFRTA